MLQRLMPASGSENRHQSCDPLPKWACEEKVFPRSPTQPHVEVDGLFGKNPLAATSAIAY